MARYKRFLPVLALPIFAFAAFGIFYIVWALLDLPPKDEVIRLAELYFQQYGLITIFVCALIESALFVGWYFPGSLVIVLGVVLARGDIAEVLGVYAVTTLGFMFSYLFNFYVGKYGWYRIILALGFREPLENAQNQLSKYGPRAIFLTYWHPNLGALTSTAAGILRMPQRTFVPYSIVATAFFNACWTFVGYVFGEFSIELIGPKFVVLFISAWIVLALVYHKMKGQEAPLQEQSSSTKP